MSLFPNLSGRSHLSHLLMIRYELLLSPYTENAYIIRFKNINKKFAFLKYSYLSNIFLKLQILVYFVGFMIALHKLVHNCKRNLKYMYMNKIHFKQLPEEVLLLINKLHQSII